MSTVIDWLMFGRAVDVKMLQMRLSFRDMPMYAGVSPSTAHRVVHNRKSCNADHYLQLCAFLDVDPRWFRKGSLYLTKDGPEYLRRKRI